MVCLQPPTNEFAFPTLPLDPNKIIALTESLMEVGVTYGKEPGQKVWEVWEERDPLTRLVPRLKDLDELPGRFPCIVAKGFGPQRSAFQSQCVNSLVACSKPDRNAVYSDDMLFGCKKAPGWCNVLNLWGPVMKNRKMTVRDAVEKYLASSTYLSR